MNHGVAKDIERAAKILVVDDDENIRDSLREAFEDQGYDAVTAADGRKALEILHHGAQRPDLVVLDLVMPAVDGWRVYETMQADPALSRVPVIVSTPNLARAPSGAVVLPKSLKLACLLACSPPSHGSFLATLRPERFCSKRAWLQCHDERTGGRHLWEGLPRAPMRPPRRSEMSRPLAACSALASRPMGFACLRA